MARSKTTTVAVLVVFLILSTALLVASRPFAVELISELPAPIAEALIDFVSLSSTQLMSAHILINWAVALAAAISTGTFEVKRVADFLWQKIAPLLLTYFAAQALGGYLDLGWLAVTVFTLIEARLLADLVGNLGLLGIPIPEGLATLFERQPLKYPC